MLPSQSVPQIDLYTELGLQSNATEEEIRSAYYGLARLYHPDRNQNNPEAIERFQRINNAYAVLSSPSKREQYDNLGFCTDGIQLSEVPKIARVAGAIFNKLIRPLKTIIEPQVLAKAQELTNDHFSDVRELEPGQWMKGTLRCQEAHFYCITIREEDEANGVILRCKSSSDNRFKLIVFDREGLIRVSQEGVRRPASNSSSVVADLFFVPNEVAKVFDCEQEKFGQKLSVSENVPDEFRSLDNICTQDSIMLHPGDHLIAVYCDNFLMSFKYSLVFAPLDTNFRRTMQKFTDSSKELIKQKEMLHEFEKEYAEVQEKYIANKRRLRSEEILIDTQLEAFNEAREDLFRLANEKYKSKETPAPRKSPKSIFKLFKK